MIGNYLQSLGLSDKYLQIINKKLKETAQTGASRTSRIFCESVSILKGF